MVRRWASTSSAKAPTRRWGIIWANSAGKAYRQTDSQTDRHCTAPWCRWEDWLTDHATSPRPHTAGWDGDACILPPMQASARIIRSSKLVSILSVPWFSLSDWLAAKSVCHYLSKYIFFCLTATYIHSFCDIFIFTCYWVRKIRNYIVIMMQFIVRA